MEYQSQSEPKSEERESRVSLKSQLLFTNPLFRVFRIESVESLNALGLKSIGSFENKYFHSYRNDKIVRCQEGEVVYFEQYELIINPVLPSKQNYYEDIRFERSLVLSNPTNVKIYKCRGGKNCRGKFQMEGEDFWCKSCFGKPRFEDFLKPFYPSDLPKNRFDEIVLHIKKKTITFDSENIADLNDAITSLKSQEKQVHLCEKIINKKKGRGTPPEAYNNTEIKKASLLKNCGGTIEGLKSMISSLQEQIEFIQERKNTQKQQLENITAEIKELKEKLYLAETKLENLEKGFF